MMHRMGYMGIPLSNSEEMASRFSEAQGFTDCELVPLMSARNVIDALVKGEIDYGVLAVENIFAGKVGETEDALKGVENVETVDTMWTFIHHCVFKKDKDSDIRCIVSHIQALLQSENNLKKLYPNAEWKECEDTAYAAEMLAKGELPDDCAAVCRKAAGEFYNLCLDSENVEDNKENRTLFSLIRIA